MTITEIAKAAGVSASAVSRYFNNGYLSSEKKLAIQKVVEANDYVPITVKARERKSKSKLIGVILPTFDNYATNMTMEGIDRGINEKGYHMLVGYTRHDAVKERRLLKEFESRGVDGIILIAGALSQQLKRHIRSMSVPVVVLGQNLPGIYSVFHDDYYSLYEMTSLLIERGCKNVGFIGFETKDNMIARQGLNGYKACCSDKKLNSSKKQCAFTDNSTSSGYASCQELMTLYPGIDGIVCASDDLALGAMKYLSTHSIRIPEDVSVTGHGDSQLSRSVTPSLTTVRFKFGESGVRAVDILDTIANEGYDSLPLETQLDYIIIPRDSIKSVKL